MNDDELDALRATVLSYVRRRVRDAHAAEDLAQDVMLKLHANGPIDDDPTGRRATAWALRVARNALTDYYRWRGVRRHEPIDRLDATGDDAPTARHALPACVGAMVERLPPAFAQAVRAADMEGVPQADLARRLGMSLSGAKSRVQRGRERLRQLVEACCDVELDARGGVADFTPTPRSREYCGAAAPCLR